MRFPAPLFAVAAAFAPTLAGAQSAPPAPAPPAKPNILLLIADDLGWNAVSYHNGFARTPHIDALVHRGVELDRFYAAPMCSPTRAGILTGCYPLRLGIGRSVIRPWV
jgi:arylsulfatase B